MTHAFLPHASFRGRNLLLKFTSQKSLFLRPAVAFLNPNQNHCDKMTKCGQLMPAWLSFLEGGHINYDATSLKRTWVVGN